MSPFASVYGCVLVTTSVARQISGGPWVQNHRHGFTDVYCVHANVGVRCSSGETKGQKLQILIDRENADILWADLCSGTDFAQTGRFTFWFLLRHGASLVRHCPVQQSQALPVCPSFSCPAMSCPAFSAPPIITVNAVEFEGKIKLWILCCRVYRRCVSRRLSSSHLLSPAYLGNYWRLKKK